MNIQPSVEVIEQHLLDHRKTCPEFTGELEEERCPCGATFRMICPHCHHVMLFKPEPVDVCEHARTLRLFAEKTYQQMIDDLGAP